MGLPIAIIICLLFTEPVYTLFLSRIFFKEKITYLNILAVILAVIGIFFLFSPWSINFQKNLTGLSISLVGGVLLSIWVLYGRKAGLEKFKPLDTIFGYSVFIVVWLVLLYPLISLFPTSISNFSINYSINIWAIIILFALVARTIAPYFFYKGLLKKGALIGGVVLLFEPLTSIILAFLLFSEILTLTTFIGASLILSANFIINSKSFKLKSK